MAPLLVVAVEEAEKAAEEQAEAATQAAQELQTQADELDAQAEAEKQNATNAEEVGSLTAMIPNPSLLSSEAKNTAMETQQQATETLTNSQTEVNNLVRSIPLSVGAIGLALLLREVQSRPHLPNLWQAQTMNTVTSEADSAVRNATAAQETTNALQEQARCMPTGHSIITDAFSIESESDL